MLASILIIAFSLVLLVYWFRASCQLLLRNHGEQALSTAALPDSRFSYPQVQARLNNSDQLGELQALLNRDFQILTYLRQHAADLESGSFEDQLLILDYRVMRWYYRLMSKAAPSQARSALSEMARVVGMLAGKMAPETSEF